MFTNKWFCFANVNYCARLSFVSSFSACWRTFFGPALGLKPVETDQYNERTTSHAQKRKESGAKKNEKKNSRCHLRSKRRTQNIHLFILLLPREFLFRVILTSAIPFLRAMQTGIAKKDLKFRRYVFAPSYVREHMALQSCPDFPLASPSISSCSSH